MAPLRVAVIVLLFLNLLALALWKGWLGGGVPAGEPERLSNQLKPEAIRLVAETRAPAPRVQPEPSVDPSVDAQEEAPPEDRSALQSPLACVAFVGLNQDQSRELAARLARAGSGFELKETRLEQPSSWWVHIPSLGSREGAEKKAGELRRLGVNELFIVQEAGPAQFAISLGLYKNEAAAGRHLAALQERGVRSAQVLTRGSSSARVEVRGPVDALATLASDLSDKMGGTARQACTP
ncbi:SPOR domain-containing protein [Zoogloea sp.]|uniref:SPOR domain-containing protein n=1 Tax=Zoogloea sp. TaxID=49181 RepID=UPI00260C4F10|nr:SPOR domain-containing protein [Zoogloea sp.]MDD3353712.1 SPOR domain-containing protein [Zoogloea sp.]